MKSVYILKVTNYYTRNHSDEFFAESEEDAIKCLEKFGFKYNKFHKVWKNHKAQQYAYYYQIHNVNDVTNLTGEDK